MQIQNLTPHSVTILDGEFAGEHPSTGIARIDGLPLGPVVGLPEPAEGTLYVVSVLVAERCPDRADLRVPGEQVRDGQGRIVGCRGLSLPASCSPALALLQRRAPEPVLVIFGSYAREGSFPNDLDVIFWGMSLADAKEAARAWLRDQRGSDYGVKIDAHPELAQIVDGKVRVSIPHPYKTAVPPSIVVAGQPEVVGLEVRTIPALLRRFAEDEDVDAFVRDFEGGDLSVFASPEFVGPYTGNGTGALQRAIGRVSDRDQKALNERVPGLVDLLVAFAEGPCSTCLPALALGTPAGAGEAIILRIARYDADGEWLSGPAIGGFGLSLRDAAQWLRTGVLPPERSATSAEDYEPSLVRVERRLAARGMLHAIVATCRLWRVGDREAQRATACHFLITIAQQVGVTLDGLGDATWDDAARSLLDFGSPDDDHLSPLLKHRVADAIVSTAGRGRLPGELD